MNWTCLIIPITNSNRQIFTFYDDTGTTKLVELDSTLDPANFDFRINEESQVNQLETNKANNLYYETLSNNPFKANNEFLVGIILMENTYSITVTVGCRTITRHLFDDWLPELISVVNISGVEDIYEGIVHL